MKITRVYAEAKKSMNFQTYSVGLEGTIEESDDPIAVVKGLKARCRQLVQEEIDLDKQVQRTKKDWVG